jgi:GT2 family glycosyltransferase
VTFWEHFLRLLPFRPTQALAALYWHLTRRRVRARNRLRVASADLPFAYSIWIANNEKSAEIAAGAGGAVKDLGVQPRFSILLHATGAYTNDQLDRSSRSVERQIYPWLECVDAKIGGLNAAIQRSNGDFIVPLRVGDALSEAALFRFAQALQLGKVAVLYGDQDELDDHGRRSRPWFKPRWNEEMFLAKDYLTSAVAIETSLARKVLTELPVDGSNSLDAIVLAATSEPGSAIVHLPHIVCHVHLRDQEDTGRMAAVSRHIEALGGVCVPGPFGTVKVEWPLPDALPLVSIIIPTKDKLDLLRPCVQSVLERTDYDNFELVIVDNGSVEKPTLDYLAEVVENPKVRVVAYPGPYNFSAINNFAARQAVGSFLCLLNNDTEVVSSAWLTEMMRYAVRADIGAVGAKLLYEDGSIQHAGVVVGIGGAAGHAHRFLPADQPGYFCQAHVAQFVSAVTAACLVIEKKKFDAVGGLDEEDLAIAFNDVDLCLKIEAAGWRNVYVPHAVLLHHESKSRGNDFSPRNIERYLAELKALQGRWGTKTYDDPLHNPNLDRYSETFVIRL